MENTTDHHTQGRPVRSGKLRVVAAFLHSSGTVNGRRALYHERGLTMQMIGARQCALRVFLARLPDTT